MLQCVRFREVWIVQKAFIVEMFIFVFVVNSMQLTLLILICATELPT